MTVGAVVVGAWRLLHRRLLREGWLRLLSGDRWQANLGQWPNLMARGD